MYIIQSRKNKTNSPDVAIPRCSICKQTILASVVFLLFATTAWGKITKGPFLLRVYHDRAAIMFETDTEGPGKVCYGQGFFLTEKITTRPLRIEYENEEDTPTQKKCAYIHKVWLRGLKQGKTCKYKVEGPQDKSRQYKFRTPDAKTNKVRFIVYGDNRTYSRTHRKLIKLMINKKVDFVVNSGDLVTKGDRYEQWGPQFFQPLKGLAETVPVYIAKGNHDLGGYFEKLLVPEEEQNNFGFDYGPVHYFCADNVSDGIGTEELLSLIAADASSAVRHPAESDAKWKFVSYHIPSLNFGGHSSMWAYPKALPTLARAGVDFVITGHSHLYERFKPIVPADEKNRLLTCITSGGGGGPLYDPEPCQFHVRTEKVHHFCLFDIDGDKLSMDTIDINGKIIDHLEITKTNGAFNKGYTDSAVPIELVTSHQHLYRSLSGQTPK